MLYNQTYDNEGFVTETSEEQEKTEKKIRLVTRSKNMCKKDSFLSYIKRKLNRVSFPKDDEFFAVWDPFYMLYPMFMMDYSNNEEVENYKKLTCEFLRNHKNKYCGWSGLRYDHPSLIPLYGTIILIGIIGTEEAYGLIDKSEFYQYLLKCKNEDGSFSASPGCEFDLRSTFSAIFIAWILDILTPEITENVIEYTLQCMNYDGGFGPFPNCESHGGYTYSGVSILHILGKLDLINTDLLVRWLADRQCPYGGGFNGRTNKLVDTCYCWWVGSPCRTMSDYLKTGEFWDPNGITSYLFDVAQSENGGFCDRPNNPSDSFHTNWGSAGFCVCGNTNNPDTGLTNVPEVNSVAAMSKERFDRIRQYFANKKY